MPEQAGSPPSRVRARLLPAAGALATAFVVAGAVPAAAEEAAAADATAPHPLCQVTDPRLPELSGLVVLGEGLGWDAWAGITAIVGANVASQLLARRAPAADGGDTVG